MNYTIAFASIAVTLRLITPGISIWNERRLKAQGALEFGKGNSRVLALAHAVFYVCAIYEGFCAGRQLKPFSFEAVGLVGLMFYLFGILSLAAVINALGRQWTVKLLVSPRHILVTTGIYRHAHHPNYFLNILPELIGFALVMQAHKTLLFGIPLYAIPLWIRIRGENSAMSKRFPNYMP